MGIKDEHGHYKLDVSFNTKIKVGDAVLLMGAPEHVKQLR